jgi:hypothetical protein
LRYGYYDETQQRTGDKSMSIKINNSYIVECLSDEYTGWIRRLQIERDGKTYRANLYWDMFDGFELIWVDEEPDWADEIEVDELYERTAN